MNKIIIALIIAALPISTFAATVHFDQSLAYGMSGSPVESLQEFLATQNCFSHEPTGYFGFITLAAVKCFQSANGVPSTGYFGVLSRAAANGIVDTLLASSTDAAIQETGSAPQPQNLDVVTTPAPAPVVSQPSVITATAAPVAPTSFVTSTPVCEASSTAQTVPITINGEWSHGTLALTSDQGYKANYSFSTNPNERSIINWRNPRVFEFWNLSPATYSYSVALDGGNNQNGTFTVASCPQ